MKRKIRILNYTLFYMKKKERKLQFGYGNGAERKEKRSNAHFIYGREKIQGRENNKVKLCWKMYLFS